MKYIILLTTIAAALNAQPSATVSGKLVLDSSRIAKKLYGKLPVFHGSVILKNQGPATVTVGGADINLALSTVPTISSVEGQALTNQAYQQKSPQRIMNIVTLVASGIGLATGVGGGIAVGIHTLAWLLFGVSFGQQGLVPFFSAGNPPMQTFNPCDPLNISLSAGQAINCDVWVEQPPKGAEPLKSVYSIDLESVAPVAPLPPSPPPVQLKRRLSETIHINPDASAVQLSHLDYARQLYYAKEYRQSLAEYNAAIKEHPEDAGLWREASGSLYQLGDEGKELAGIILEKYKN